MDFKFDMSAILDAKLNAELSKDKEIRPVLAVLKKYGIQGWTALSFLRDMAVALNSINGADAENG